MILNLIELSKKYNCIFNGVLHIGAHFGQEYNVYKKLGIEPLIFIEPLPKSFDVLTKNVGKECICINKAVGNIEGEVEMYVDETNKGGSSSVLKPKLHLQQYRHIQFPYKIKVSITKIDSLDIPQCNFINMDIQGYELEALRGASKYLSGVEYLMLEVNRDEVYENCARIEEIDSYLKQYELIRVETNWAGGTWGDAFYVKQKKLLYFVTSLPRTGTTSLCQMAYLCGLKSQHVLHDKSFLEMLNQKYTFFADTPFYDPLFLIGLLEGIQNQYNIKFIYSHKEILSHQNSLKKLYQIWRPPDINKIFDKLSLIDNLSYNKLLFDNIKNHYNYIKKISTFYNIEMLDYQFDQGWSSFCNFINSPIPDVPLPHLNKL
jgi:FkbM family methyltransferase